MSRTLHRQMMLTVDALDKVNELIEESFKKSEANQEQIVVLLSECQDSAVAMGGMIERLYGKETESVKELKAYCDLLYPFAMALHNWNDRRRILLQLIQHITRLRTLIAQEVPNRLEVVFFPYKAAMWDSLESIYLAARQDLDCDAYVVPVPYYDLRPDRSFGQLHYEGKQFPDGIKIMDWRDYHFEERCPDVIYIHNPYDDCNLITSVIPRYYARNLRQYTGCLVYIPYFVLEEINPDDYERIEGIKHFCVLPGVIHAHKVIVQSEKMRRIYISEYRKMAEEANVKFSQEQLEKKFLGLGSPKFDKLFNTKKDDCVLPMEWLKKIQKSDGTRRKVIFYNTSIAAFLKYKEMMLKKIQYVFSVFREKQEEMTLLWRPHPLMQATIASMHSELSKPYKALLDTYLEEGWGIYDDTPYMDRAIAISDGYYGDASSVVQMYQVTGKPVVVQDPLITGDDFYAKIHIGTYVDGSLWGLGIPSNELYMIDLKSGNTNFLSAFGEGMYRQVVAYGNKFILIPGCTAKLTVYEKDTGHIYHLDINRKPANENKLKYFSVGAQYKDFIYFFPAIAEYILILNIKTMHIEYMEDPVAEYEKKYGKTTYLFAGHLVQEGGIIYIPCFEKNVLFVMNLETRAYEWEDIPISIGQQGILSIAKNANTIWVITQDGFVFEWDRGKRKIQLLLQDETLYVGLVYIQNALWIVPQKRNFVIRYKDRVIESIKCNDDIKSLEPIDTMDDIITTADGKIYTGLVCANGVVEIDTIRKQINFIKFNLLYDTCYSYLKSKSVVAEDQLGGVNNALKFLLQKANRSVDGHYAQNCGSTIYRKVIN